MKRSLAVIREIVLKELYQVRQDKRMLVLSVMAPVLQVFLLGYTATTDITNSGLLVSDQDRTVESRDFIRSFTASGYFITVGETDRPGEVDRFIEEGRAKIALVLPRGFGRARLAGEPAPVQVILDGTDANTASILLGYATQIVSSSAQSILATYRMQGRGVPARILPEPRIWFNPDLRSSHFMVPGVVAMVLMIITMTLTSLAVVKEKEIGTLEQLLVTPIRPAELIIGKLIPFVAIGFLDMIVVLALAHYWFEVPLRGSVTLLFALSGLFILTTLGLGLFISTVARSQQQAMLIAQFFIFLPFIFLSGFTFPIANMPVVIQYITYLIPLRYFLEIVRGVFLKGASLRELWPQAAALAAFGVTILTLSVFRFRRTIE